MPKVVVLAPPPHSSAYALMCLPFGYAFGHAFRQVGTSSCAFMILWTALSGVVSYGADGNLGAGLAVWCVSFGFISGQIGQRLVNHILKKTGRPSYVVFLLGTIIGAACIAMASGLIAKIIMGDYDANDIIEKNETAATHLFYWGSGFGCSD
mgnify:CR=1 FL=1